MDGPVPWLWFCLSRRHFVAMTGCNQTMRIDPCILARSVAGFARLLSVFSILTYRLKKRKASISWQG